MNYATNVDKTLAERKIEKFNHSVKLFIDRRSINSLVYGLRNASFRISVPRRRLVFGIPLETREGEICKLFGTPNNAFFLLC